MIAPTYDFAPVVSMTHSQRLARYVSYAEGRYFPRHDSEHEIHTVFLPTFPSWLGFDTAEDCLEFLDGYGSRLDARRKEFGIE